MFVYVTQRSEVTLGFLLIMLANLFFYSLPLISKTLPTLKQDGLVCEEHGVCYNKKIV